MVILLYSVPVTAHLEYKKNKSSTLEGMVEEMGILGRREVMLAIYPQTL